ncbi:polysaccharide deacetylase family protein [Effusibacillus pohliae]|uniref:polysaccharide deacetylase family protein n=1 Tax=Effusibacillus pohliae TaxID=232270 RepID=UPI0012EA4C41|nr:polysaccharide deacetylase family protein [Effusibacillus pohliae]
MRKRFCIGTTVLMTGLLLGGCLQRAVPPAAPPGTSPPPAAQPGGVPGPAPNAAHPTAPTPAYERDRPATPDLTGGPESQNRTARTTPREGTDPSRILYFSGPRTAKQVALTFDDGPDLRFTPQILDILKQNGVKATFFIVGTRAQAHPEMVRRIVAEGHAIGNHTWDHPKLTKLTPQQIRDEVVRTDQLLDSIVGYYPALFRPPYGLTNPDIVREIGAMGYKIIDWSVDTRDWAGTPVPQMMDYVRTELRPGAIILEHCAGGRSEDLSNTVSALPQIIDTLKAQGYTFVTVPQLLNIPAAKMSAE